MNKYFITRLCIGRLTGVLTVFLAALAVIVPAPAFSDGGISVELDGTELTFDVQPMLIENRTMVPMRGIFEELGALVKWDDETETVTARKGGKTVTMTIGKTEMSIDKGDMDETGSPVVETSILDAAPVVVSDRTLVPLRAVSEAFGIDVEWRETELKAVLRSKEDDDSWKSNTAVIDLNTMTCSSDGVVTERDQIIIARGGDYTVTGSLSGTLLVNSDDKVKLRLDGVNITSSGAPCIYIENADKAFITIEKGSENSLLSIGSEKGAVYSKEDLEIKGSGSLYISADTGHGIKASDDLTIEDGTVVIKSAADGVHVNDTFRQTGGSLEIEAAGDGIDSESIVIIEDGSINIKTTGEPDNAAELNQTGAQPGGRPQETADAVFASSAKGVNAEWMMVIRGGIVNISSTDHALHCADEVVIDGGELSLTSGYGKGISGHGDVTVNNGAVDITKSTEGIESKSVLTINGGDIDIVSSDDGMNGTGGRSGEQFGGGMRRPAGADGTLEGEEGFAPPGRPDAFMPGITDDPHMDGAYHRLNDGMDNAIPGRTNSEPPDGEFAPGQPRVRPDMPEGGAVGDDGGFASLPVTLVINGGDIEVKAGDDCFDANGSIVINGGFVKAVSGGGIVSVTGVFDADGAITIGGEAQIIAAACNGGAQGLSSPSGSVILYTDSMHSAGETVRLCSLDGSVLMEYTPDGEYSTLYITSSVLMPGGSYTLSTGSEAHEAVMNDSLSLTIGTARSIQNEFGGMHGGMAGGRPERQDEKIFGSVS